MIRRHASSIVVVVSTLCVLAFAAFTASGATPGAPNPGQADPIRVNGIKLRTAAATGLLIEDSSGNDLGRVVDDGTGGSFLAFIGANATFGNIGSGAQGIQFEGGQCGIQRNGGTGGLINWIANGSTWTIADAETGGNTLATLTDNGTTGTFLTNRLQAAQDLYLSGAANTIIQNAATLVFEDASAGNDLATLEDLGSTGRLSVTGTFRTDFIQPYGGTVVTIEDVSGNDMATFTDAGTTGVAAVNGTLTVNGAGTSARPFCTGCAHAGLLALTAEATSASTTPANVSELSWSVPAGNVSLQCEFQTRTAATTTGVQVGVDLSNAPASINGTCDTWTGAATFTRATFNADDGACAFVDMAAASPAVGPYRMQVYVAGLGSPSTVTIRLRSEVGASTVRLDAGSWCTLSST